MTTMTQTNLALQVYQVFIKATPEQIWDAITKSEFTTRYSTGASSSRASSLATSSNARASGSGSRARC